MNKHIIGQRIKVLMKEEGINMQELASDLGISERAVYSYILGERIPSDQIKIKMAERLNRTVGYIFFS